MLASVLIANEFVHPLRLNFPCRFNSSYAEDFFDVASFRCAMFWIGRFIKLLFYWPLTAMRLRLDYYYWLRLFQIKKICCLESIWPYCIKISIWTLHTALNIQTVVHGWILLRRVPPIFAAIFVVITPYCVFAILSQAKFQKFLCDSRYFRPYAMPTSLSYSSIVSPAKIIAQFPVNQINLCLLSKSYK